MRHYAIRPALSFYLVLRVSLEFPPEGAKIMCEAILLGRCKYHRRR